MAYIYFHKMDDMEIPKEMITVEITVNKPVNEVWIYWTDPNHIVNWTFASPEWHAPFASNDLRVGGEFKTTMAAKDGSVEFDFIGKYTTVVASTRIESALADGRKVFVSFKDLGDQTYITEVFDPENMHDPEFQRAGWQAILDNFKIYAEQQP